MKLVYKNGAFQVEGRDFRWERDRLLFQRRIVPTDVTSVVDMVRSTQHHYGMGLRPLERVLDPAQKMVDGGSDDGRMERRGGGLS